jgi:hypothetical protein
MAWRTDGIGASSSALASLGRRIEVPCPLHDCITIPQLPSRPYITVLLHSAPPGRRRWEVVILGRRRDV